MSVETLLVFLTLLLPAALGIDDMLVGTDKNETNVFVRALGQDAEDKRVRRGPTMSFPDGPQFRESEILVEGSPLELPPDIQVVKYCEKSHLTVVKVKKGNEKALVKRLREKGRFAEENYYMYASRMTPDDQYYSPYQWHMDAVQAREAWDISMGQGVVVAVLDTGLRITNGDGIGCVRRGYNAVTGTNNPNDNDGHGTHVAGTIAQRTNNGRGAAGLAHGACIMPVKVLGDDGSGTFADIAEGIRWAVDNGAKVINMSLGVDANANMRRDGGVVDRALQYAYANGVTVVAAAGNEGVGALVSYPGIYPTCISVGATDYLNKKAYYSNYGEGLDIVAPGGDVTQDRNGDGYGDGVLQETIESNRVGLHFFHGTSMASPHVAAAAAMVISAGVANSPDEVRAVLTKSAKKLGSESMFGKGLLQIHSALTFNQATKPPKRSCSSFAKRKACKRRGHRCSWRRRKCRSKT